MRCPSFRPLLPLLVFTACTDTLPSLPVVTSVEPASGPNGLPTTILIRGANFAIGVRTNFDDPNGSKLDNAVIVRLGEFDLLDAHVVSKTEIAATVQPGLPNGPYEILIVDGLGRSAKLAAAYTVRDTTCSDHNLAGTADCTACSALSGCQCDASMQCIPRCGDGVVRAPEECDDLDNDDGDGCTAGCTVEPGWVCDDEPSNCLVSCGDGLRAAVEDCDDGNNMAGDGCSASCSIEAGFHCGGELGGMSTCSSTCGDGLIASTEVCDDGNMNANDGCSDTCMREPGFSCPTAGQLCVTVCGDGILVGQEACDDHNVQGNDGCSAICELETGFSCPTPGSACVTTCGDSIRAGQETCDDGNLNAADGCSDTCALETGWSCTTDGSPCVEVCDDGILVGVEDCDDGNLDDGDGCSSTCHHEDGYVCATIGSPCTALCGDSVIVLAETCDDGNMTAGDGCSDLCIREDGFTCLTPGDPCSEVCGDGLVVGLEGCDDTDLDPGDGCSDVCRIEPGYVCPDQGQDCFPECGDGMVIAPETCDDSNATGNDGCSAGCAEELGWSCPSTGGACVTRCGDSIQTFVEACDDGNIASNDGCSSSCTLESGWTCGTPGTACTTDCGDSILVSPQEACDDGNENSNDGCDAICRIELGYECLTVGQPCTPDCGDSRIIAPETCDDGNEVDGDGCDVNCQPSCGNNRVDPGNNEQCDDGNTIDADGCEADCTNPRCGNLIVDPPEQCDDGNTNDADGCEGDCTTPFCGNSITDPGELCDDGNAINGDGCETDCSRSPTCVDATENGTETGVDCGGTCPTPCIIISFPLRGNQVVPASGSPSRAECTIEVAGSRGTFRLDCTHDIGDATTVAIELGAPGDNGPQVMDLGSALSPISVSSAITAGQLADLQHGDWYVRINSVGLPNGDVRGQAATLVRFPIVPRQVVPAIATVNGNGSCSAWLSPDGTQLSVSCTHNVIATAVKIHRGAPGTTGPELYTIASGAGPIDATATFTAGDAADFLAGNLYLSVETAANPAGEMRGQLAQTVESTGAGEQVVPASASTEIVSCRSIISANQSSWNLHCTHNLTGVTAAEIHRGAPGQTGALAFNLGTGTSPIDVALGLTATDYQQLQDGDLYLELRSASFPAGAVRAQISRNFSFPLDGRQHVPERVTARFGHCLAHMNPGETTLRFECTHNVTDVTNAHMHHGSPAVAGALLMPEFLVFTSPFAAAWNLSATDVTTLLAGDFYVHIHSLTFPNPTGGGGGELRGQVTDTYEFALTEGEVVPPTGSAATGDCVVYVGANDAPAFIVNCDHTVVNPAGIDLRLGAIGVDGTLIQIINTPGATGFRFQGALTPTNLAELRNGNLYLELRSTAFPQGELRGQILK